MEVLRLGSQCPRGKYDCHLHPFPLALNGHLTHCPAEPQKRLHLTSSGGNAPLSPPGGARVYRKSLVSRKMETGITFSFCWSQVNSEPVPTDSWTEGLCQKAGHIPFKHLHIIHLKAQYESRGKISLSEGTWVSSNVILQGTPSESWALRPSL